MTPHAYAVALSLDPSLRTSLSVDLVTVFVPALDAYDLTDPGLPEAERWRLAADLIAGANAPNP